MIFRTGEWTELDAVCALYENVVAAMEASGLDQWHWGDYPSRELLQGDLEKGRLVVGEEDGRLAAAFVVNLETDREYENVDWFYGAKPGAMHRLAVSPDCQGKGVGRAAFAAVEDRARALGCDSLRLDTFSGNARAQALYRRQGMREAGEVVFPWREEPFVCFEKPLTADCPLLPIRMEPAFRSGAMTPWGGEKLRGMFDKAIPDDTTGESLEVSCIPGLESRAMTGETLPDLIARYGEKLVGRYAGKPFPLLLKLLDAKGTLSVQVHPNDAFAAAHEDGKLGKDEAWLILQAEEGTALIYGLTPGVTRESLRTAAEGGAEVEALLRRMPVKAGDVLFIPAGCVHALCGGVLLYEIQQSSDVTYRFYDWDRVDAKGQRRPLHVDKALAATDLAFAGEPIRGAGCGRVLDTKHFTLDLIRSMGMAELPKVTDFGILTALDVMEVVWEGGSKALWKGETLLLPAACPKLTIYGMGRAILAMPATNREEQ